MRTETLYHGSHRNTEGLVVHEGLCLTRYDDVAETYAGREGTVYATELDLLGLRIADVDGFDWEAATCPADDDDFRAEYREDGVDVLSYTDVDERGCEHDCYRLISDRALAAIITSTTYDA